MFVRLSAVLWLFTGLLAAESVPAAVDYDGQIQPIFAERCFSCHSQEKRSGGLSLYSYEDVLNGGRNGSTVRTGNSADSLLMLRITGENQPRMPLVGAALNDGEIALIRAWIDQGARRTANSAPAKGKWEAPLTLEKPTIPPVVWQDWQSPLDRFTAVYLKANGFAEPELVSDRLFIRRVYLDVWGLLPPPKELASFLKDHSPNKREKLVNKLLASPENYAQNWISFWNDLLRNDEGVNYHNETASRKSISSWLLTALENNLPYDQFVYKLLNPAAPTDPAGFLIGVNWRGVVSASQTPAMQAAQNTAQIFLGINLKCNSCHDSFISKWKLKDAYSLAGYFSTEEKLQLFRCDVAQEQYASPAFLYPVLNRTPASGSVADRRSAAAAIFTDPRNGRLSRTLVNRLWQRLLGRGLVENPDEMDGEPWSPELLDWLASDFVESGYDMKHLIATILSSRTYQLPSVPSHAETPKRYVFAGPEVRRITAEQFADTIGSLTGEWHVYQEPDPEPDPKKPAPEIPPIVPPKPGIYAREWRVASTSLTRALGRPIRDQVYAVRDTQPTTLQALELVNGEPLTHWLNRGARKMLGELPPEPTPAVDLTQKTKTPPQAFEIDVSHAHKLWLLVADTGSYSPEKVEALWGGVELVGHGKVTPLSSLKTIDDTGLRVSSNPIELRGANGDGIRVKTPSRLVYDISGQGYTILRGVVGIENKDVTSDINPNLRFFVFQTEPNMERLTPVLPQLPVEAEKSNRSPARIVNRVFLYTLGRRASPEEKRTAEEVLIDGSNKKRATPDGLADLLWAILMKPEFQLIY
jgi:mono/diheme cytochrome c family protein